MVKRINKKTSLWSHWHVSFQQQSTVQALSSSLGINDLTKSGMHTLKSDILFPKENKNANTYNETTTETKMCLSISPRCSFWAHVSLLGAVSEWRLVKQKMKKDQILGPFFLIAQPLYSSFNDQQQKIITKNNYVLQKQTQFKDKFNIHNQLIMCQ